MKKFLRILVLTISVLIVSVPVFASDVLISSYDTMLINETYGNLGYDPSVANGISSNSITVQLNGELIDFTDENGNKVEPQILNDRTMVPMRKIFEVLGADIEWNGETRSIKATTDDLEIGLQIDNTLATVTNKSGDVTEITLDSAPVIINDRTLVPVRFIAESLDKKVGWDEYNRAVIIIDTSFIGETLKEDASNLYEYLTTDFEKIKTYEMGVELTGKVKYEDTEIKSNNTSLNIVGDMDLKLSETAMQIDLDLNLTGKGILIESVKEEGVENIEASVIMDMENGVMYMTSPLMEGYEDKWIKASLSDEEKEEFKAILELAKSEETSEFDMLVDMLVLEDDLTTTSYTEMQSMLQLVTMFMGNENFKVSGRTTKTYTYNLDLSEIIQMIMEMSATDDIQIDEDAIKFEIGFEVKVADRAEKESACNIVLEVKQGTEKISMDIEAKGVVESYNEKVTIKMPKAADVIEM